MSKTISLLEAKRVINFMIDNNIQMQEKGITPIAVALESDPGIGKTSLIEQIADERKMRIVKLNLAQMDEVGDLIGYPIKEYECQVATVVKNADGTKKMKVMPDKVWVNEQMLSQTNAGVVYRQTGKTRMGYAKPAWIPEYCESGTICLLDDYVRASPQLLQSAMELILTQKYISWSLPKKTTIVLTNNIDDGNSNVSSLDEAQKTRFMNYHVSFDSDAWSQWAESAGIDGRCINFVMSYSSELFSADDNGARMCNPRSFTMFANSISNIKDWDSNLAFINMLSKGCFDDENGRFSSMFTSFITNKMHLLIQPEEIMKGSWDTVKKKLNDSLNDRPDIATLIERRLSNYVVSKSKIGELDLNTFKNRALDIIREGIFSKDMLYHLLKTTINNNLKWGSKLLTNQEISTILA